MNTACRFLKALAHQQPRVLDDVLVRLNKQPVLEFIKAGRDRLRNGLEICSRLQIQFTGFEDLASCGGDEGSISLVAAINGVSRQIRRLAAG